LVSIIVIFALIKVNLVCVKVN